MRVLALQLKRIGDLVLTTPALDALKTAGIEVTLAVDRGTSGLLPAIPQADAAIVFGRGKGWTPWQQVLTGRFDAVLDFTGTDRSALATAISRAPQRITFGWVQKKRLKSLAYRRFIESNVRDRHTVDHYLDLVAGLSLPTNTPSFNSPRLSLPRGENAEPSRPYAVIHPGTARPEKFWLADRWSEVARHLTAAHQLPVVITTGPDPSEISHARQIQQNATGATIETPSDLCAFARVLANARIVVSCDTAAVHLAAAFQRPQVVLFGPTNPFHWRPRHDLAAVISAAEPSKAMQDFTPRRKGAAMERIEAAPVMIAIDHILASIPGNDPHRSQTTHA